MNQANKYRSIKIQKKKTPAEKEVVKVDSSDSGPTEEELREMQQARAESQNVKNSKDQRELNKKAIKFIKKEDDEEEEGGLYPIKKTKYSSLFKKTKMQVPSTYFGIYFPDIENDWDFVFRELAEAAEPEDWSSEEKGKYGILKSYINQIFVRCYDQGKVAFSKDKTRCCFNTGLLTPEKKDIFMVFKKRVEELDDISKKWNYDCVVDSYSRKLGIFGSTPEIATFITNPEDLVFDFNYRFEVNVKHIVEDNAERIRRFFDVSDGLVKYAIEGALSKARSDLMRNYRLAVPHWYKGSIQLLIPFDVNGDENPDLTFILEKDQHMKLYRVKTVIPTEYAYMNARVLRKLDPDWIKKK